MDSLPEPKQHIDELPGGQQTQKEAYKKLARLCVARASGIKSEEELAKRAGFPSVEVMRISLENWGVVGLLPKEALLPQEEPKHARKDREAQTVAREAEKLPSAASAANLFEIALERYKGDLNLTNHLVEFLGDDRLFYAYGAYPPEPVTWSREEFSAQEWEELCVECGKGPTTTEELTFLADRSGARKASRYPDIYLTGLIGMYLLQADWREVRLLVERLHPKTRPVDWEKIKDFLYGRVKTSGTRETDGLRMRARQLAALVRGGEVKRGQKDPLSMRELGAALDVRRAREKGVSEEELSSMLREGYALDEERANRIKGFFPPEPQPSEEE